MAQKPTLSSALRKLYKLIMLDKRDVTSVYFFAILAGLLSLILPLGIQTIISFVMANTLSTSIIVLITIVIAGVFLNGFIQIRQSQVIERIMQKIFTRYTLEFSNKIPKVDLEEIDNYYLPEVVNRFFDVTALAKSIEKILLDIPASLIQITLGLILLSFYHPIFIAFGIFVFFIIIIIIRVTSPKGFNTSMDASDYKYNIGGWLEEIARGSKTFRYSKGSELHMHKSDGLVVNYLNSRTEHFKILLIQYWSLVTFKILIVATMLIAGTWLLLDNEINVGQFIASDIVIILIINSVEKLIASMDNVYDSLTSLEKLGKVVDIKLESSGNLIFEKEQGANIEFSKVNFRYPNGSRALSDIVLNLKSRTIAGINGPSGSGRSSILRLLTGAFSTYSGNILINDIPLGNYSLQTLRANTGIMLNEQDIFRGTILENLTMGNEKILISEVTDLASMTGLDRYITSNKQGYDTVLDPMGKRLSNEVIQNIKLVRALLGKPSLLLLEEPLRHLSDDVQNTLMDYLKNKSNATVLMVCSDRNLLAKCDTVIKLNNGVIKQL
jgi:ATP-binding cassette, subfamily B, bacterial